MARPLMLAPLVLPLACVTFGGRWPQDIESALVLADENRAEVERVLGHYQGGGDREKFDAACFLIANMPGHGYVEYGLYDGEDVEIAFDALDYGSYKEAMAAMDALEAEHGTLEFRRKSFIEDVHVVSAEAMIRDIDLAFETWRGRPWAQGLSFKTFCEHILPYRGSNEPVEDWRGPYSELLDDIVADLPEDAAPGEVARRMAGDASRSVGFSELYYLHPTDQGYAEMMATRTGRCEDITNMNTYAMRASGIASAADYTPWWPHRDNNHAWPVTLDADGRGKSGEGARAAKVYRKTYSKQRGNLAFQLREGEEGPPWLDRETYRDVTEQYMVTSDVTLRLDAMGDQRFAYLCVFNGGEWRPIYWGRPDGGRVTFDRMGRGILYLPASYHDGEVHPAAPPLFLTADGEVQPLTAGESDATDALLTSAMPHKVERDGEGQPISRLEPDATYELFVWRDGWESLGRRVATDAPLHWTGLPTGGLFWLVKDGSRKLERPFVLENGAQVWM